MVPVEYGTARCLQNGDHFWGATQEPDDFTNFTEFSFSLRFSMLLFMFCCSALGESVRVLLCCDYMHPIAYHGSSVWRHVSGGFCQDACVAVRSCC